MKEQETIFSIVADYYAKHYDELLGYVNKRLQFADEAEDIVQNVFLRLLQSKKMITEVTLPCLVYTIARNLIFDYWRHHTKVEEFEHYLNGCNSSSEADVASIYNVKEIEALLERSIARLDDKLQHIYMMNIYDGKQVSEIAQTLSLNYKCVEKRLGAARKAVRNQMTRLLA